jgi:hypothetical protein
MNPNAPLPEKIRIKARLDRDGIGGQDQNGDLTGELSDVAIGSKDIILQINKKTNG